MPMVDSLGNENFIDLSVDVDLSVYTKHLDPTKRLYAIHNLKEVTTAQEATVFKTFADGSKEFVRKGIRAFTAMIPSVSTRFVGQLEKFECSKKLGVFLIDSNGVIIGEKRGTKLYPLDISAFDSNYAFANDSDPNYAMVAFDFSLLMQVISLHGIPASELKADTVVPLKLKGIRSVDMVQNTVATGLTVTVTVSENIGFGKTDVPRLGLVKDDFKVVWLDNNGAENVINTVTTVVGDNTGRYVITWTGAQLANTKIKTYIVPGNFEGSSSNTSTVA